MNQLKGDLGAISLINEMLQGTTFSDLMLIKELSTRLIRDKERARIETRLSELSEQELLSITEVEPVYLDDPVDDGGTYG